jgi:hypothetical protein
MKSTHGIAGICTIALVLVCGTALAADESATSTTLEESCCFENPRFSGTCKVTPGPDESCSSILGYLNNPNSVGKAYCGNTKVRGGWTQVSCEKATAATFNTCHSTEEGE